MNEQYNTYPEAGPGTETTKPSSAINQAEDNLDKSISCLRNAVFTLSEKLYSVLSPTIPSGDKDKSLEESDSRLSTKLNKKSKEIREIRDIVDSIISRLEI